MTAVRNPSETRLAFSIPEAVELAGISRSTMYALIGAGRLPAVKIGRSTRIRRADLEIWLSSLPTFRRSTAG